MYYGSARSPYCCLVIVFAETFAKKAFTTFYFSLTYVMVINLMIIYETTKRNTLR